MGRGHHRRLLLPLLLVLLLVQTLTAFTDAAKLRVLALHGYNGNAASLCQTFSTWDQSILNLVEFDCLNGPLQDKYSKNAYTWFNMGSSLAPDGAQVSVGVFTAGYIPAALSNRADSKIDGGIAYVLDHMRRNGPYDGILGFSMGGVMAGLVTGVQAKKMVISGRKSGDLPPLRFAIIDEGGYVQGLIDDVYDPPLRTKSFHIIGNYDGNRQIEESFLQKWKNPTVARVDMSHGYLMGQNMDSTLKWRLENFLKSH